MGHSLPGVRRAAGVAGNAGAGLEPAERLRHVQAGRGDGRRQPRPPVRHPDRGPALQHRPGPAAVGLQRVLGRLPYLLPELPAGQAPTLYEDGGAIRDYVNIGDVVDANVLVLQDERAAGRVFNVGGGRSVTTREFADVVQAPVRLGPAGRGKRRVPLRRHPPHPVGHQRAAGAGLGAAALAGRLGRRIRRVAQGDGRSRRGAGRGQHQDARPGRGTQDGG